jgi:hypothetical protein
MKNQAETRNATARRRPSGLVIALALIMVSGSGLDAAKVSVAQDGSTYYSSDASTLSTGKTSIPSPAPSDDIDSQLAELRVQLATQNEELITLRSQFNQSARGSNDSNDPHWFALIDTAFVQPVQSNASGLIVETDNGYSHVMFPWQLESSPRIQFGRVGEVNALGWSVRYWQFRHGQSFDANDANGLLPTGREGTVGFLSEDGDITTGLDFIEEGSFLSNVRTDVIDFELSRKVAAPLDFYGGIRYAKLGQSYQAVTDQGIVNSGSEFRGVGPTVGLRLSHDLVKKKLSLFADLRGSLLFGQKDFSVVDNVNNLTQTLNAIDMRDFEDGIDSFASNAEIKLGCRFTPATCLTFQVALETQYYDNVGGANPTGVFTGPDSGLAGDSPLDDSLGFVGLSFGTEIAL